MLQGLKVECLGERGPHTLRRNGKSAQEYEKAEVRGVLGNEGWIGWTDLLGGVKGTAWSRSMFSKAAWKDRGRQTKIL